MEGSNMVERMRGVTRSHNFAVLRLMEVLSSVLLLCWCNITSASPVTAGRARELAGAWVTAHPRPMNSRLGSQIDSVDTFTDANSQPVYHVIYLRPNGFVITPADDLVEPIICFSTSGSYDSSDNNPLGALVSRDLPGRVNSARAVEQKIRANGTAGLTDEEMAIHQMGEDASGKWKELVGEDSNSSELLTLSSSISDIRVAPLLQSKWGQTTVSSNACFNYYTPPNSEGSASNYPCGCVATAMAQYMRFRQYPTTGVGTGCFTVYVNKAATTKCLRGGDGSGGAYDWNDMTLVPGSTTTTTQIQAIGALTYDAGVAVKMQYTSSSSGAYMIDADAAMTSTFGYSNSIYGYNNNFNISSGLKAMVNPNLDSGNPVILGITCSAGGHAVVADGYGYNSSTLYHHINLGWDGSCDAWYNLPTIDTSYYTFTAITSIVYNIYTSGTGEIISGRVLASATSLPISGATVTATKGSTTYSATTDSNGIYALTNVASSTSYTVAVTKTGYSFTSKTSSTGKSQDKSSVSGNCWGVDFNGTIVTSPPTASDSNITADVGTTQQIELQASDDGLPAAPGKLTYIITSLPQYGTLFDPCAGSTISSVPYSLVNYGKDVNYTSCACYVGDVNFHFKANDGGTSPNGGDSNVATVTITAESSQEVAYETYFDSGLPTGWTIIDGGSSTDTWRSDNPGSRTSSYLTGTFMIVDSNYAGSVDMNEQLITQSIDCTNLTGVKLRFKHYFKYYASEIGDVDIRINSGVWQNLARYQGADYSGTVELDLSGFGADGAAVQIRWHYYNANRDWYWGGIDNVQIIATPVVEAPTGDFNFDCSVDYDDLDIFISAWLSKSGDSSWDADCDISPSVDSVINELDFAVFAENWLVVE